MKAIVVNCTLKASPERIRAAEILVFASPTWLGRPSSIAQRVRRGTLAEWPIG